MKPRTWLAVSLVLLLLGVLDSFRDPDAQITAGLYIAGVHLYQKAGRPVLSGRVVCNYKPTCSVYSEEAVRRYGIREGLRLSWNRLRACSTDTPPDTFDPVPDHAD